MKPTPIFEDESMKILDFLVQGENGLAVLSIVGMPGLGKTTLAKKIYGDPLITQRFDVRAWVSASGPSSKKEFLLDILRDMNGVTDTINGMLNDQELAAKLYQNLKGRRYLIVIDDMWETEVLDGLGTCFPRGKEHSRILITSRLQSFTSLSSFKQEFLALRPLTRNESWVLFETRLRERGNLSEELLEVGSQILSNCGGNPLAIVATAEYLKQVNRCVEQWREISGISSSCIMSDPQSHWRRRVQLSYDHLPPHLRLCFLYLGAFPKGEDISADKLKLLWIAEGFVSDNQAESLEDNADEYLKDLINSSLVIATKPRTLGGVKVCRVNNFLHDFCLEISKEENFLHVIHADNGVAYDHCRVSFTSKLDELLSERVLGSSVCSLLNTAGYNDNSCPYTGDLSIFQNFELLRVLDFAYVYLNESLAAIEPLSNLRYLAIGVAIPHILPSVSRLQNLQCFLVRYRHDSEAVDIPDSFWDMVNLRHVYVCSYAYFADRLTSPSLLDSLETLSGPCLAFGDEADRLFRRLPRLRKLVCCLTGVIPPGSNNSDIRFPSFCLLAQLISLKATFIGSKHWESSCEFSFPPYLQKLTLSNFRLRWDDISKIGMELPNLKVLKLIGDDWDGIWFLNDGEFPELKYLKLSALINLEEWNAEDSFGKLEVLVVENCSRLTEIPSLFRDIPTLREITVKGCKSSVVHSAKDIQKMQQEDWQNIIKLYGSDWSEVQDSMISDSPWD